MAGAGVIAGRTMRQARCGVKGLSKSRLEQKGLSKSRVAMPFTAYRLALATGY